MNLPLSKKSAILSASLFALALIGATTGFISSHIIRSNTQDSQAASVNITVTDNDQTVTLDQSNGATTIEKSSTVTIKDPDATRGYILSAKLLDATSTITVSISSTGNTTCQVGVPCILTTTPQTILSTTDDLATTQSGDTTTFTVTITIPAEANVSDYVLDIEYSEEANPIPPGPPDPGTTHGAMQLLTNANCPTEIGQTAFDARNDQIYYVQKIPNSGGTDIDLCWMKSNLRYAGNGNWDSEWGWADDRYASTGQSGSIDPTTTSNPNDDYRPLNFEGSSSYTSAHYADPGGSTSYTNTAVSGGFYGYLYNWCAAMGGQASACDNYTTSGFDTSISICPTGWRLPTYDEYEILASSLGVTTGSAFSTAFLAVYSGFYISYYAEQGGAGRFWTSTAMTTVPVHALNYYFDSSLLGRGENWKFDAFSVRCVR